MATVKGKWEWIEWPQFSIKATIEQAINFTHDSINYTKMRFRWHNETDIEYIKSDGQVKAIFNDDDLGWYGTDNHFVDFGSTEQTVSDAFYAQLTANASQVSDVELEGNYTQTVKTADGLLKIYPKTKAKNVMLDSSAAGITAEDVQSGIKELNDKIASAESAAVKPNGTYPDMTVGKSDVADNVILNDEKVSISDTLIDISNGFATVSSNLTKIITGETPAGKVANKLTFGSKNYDGSAAQTITKSDIGLGNVDNTSDANKPVSTAQQAALDLKQNVNDNSLATTAKTVTGAINENKTAIDGIREQITNEAHFRGYFASEADLKAEYPTATPNDYAYVADAGQKSYIWIWGSPTANQWNKSDDLVPDQLTPKSTTVPLMNGTAAIGNTNTYADGAHVHPVDTSRASQTALNSEITNRTNADTALGKRIDQEITDRTAADTALGERIDGVIDGTTPVEQAKNANKADAATTATSATTAATATKATTADKVANALKLTIDGVEKTYTGAAEVAVTINTSSSNDPNAVHFTAQTLTAAQQKQARTNIGAASSSDTAISIATTKWSSNAVTLTASDYAAIGNVTASSHVELFSSDASAAAFITNNIRLTAQAAGSITISCASTPTAAITANLLILN